jgi:FkbM family methyltransferase
MTFRKLVRKIVNVFLSKKLCRSFVRPMVRQNLISWNIVREANFDDILSFEFEECKILYHLKKMDSHGARLYWYGEETFEKETVLLMKKIFPQIKCFWDVGSHMGTYSLIAASINPNIVGHAFEPIPIVYDGLKRNVEINSFQNRIQCHNFALGEENKTMPFYVHDEARAESSFTPSCPNRPFTQIINMEIKKADDLEFTKPDLIKIDVEGFEPQVLKGMKCLLEDVKPMIICEVTKWAKINELENLFSEYNIFLITEKGLIKKDNLENDHRTHGNYENYFFIHKKHIIKSI